MTNARPSSDGAAIVSDSLKWIPVTVDTPRTQVVSRINRAAGVAGTGCIGRDPFWTHWHPLPTFED